MGDIMSTEQRHNCMSHIRGKDTSAEMIVRRYLHSKGFRYSLHSKKLEGKPDVVLSRCRAVIFVNGCFWHGHEGCKSFRLPKTRESFWKEKISRNRERDIEVTRRLADQGWNVFTVWECELKRSNRDSTLERLESKLAQLREINSCYHIPPSVVSESYRQEF